MANMTFKASLIPNTDFGYSLGSSTKRWKINGSDPNNTYVLKAGDTMSGNLSIEKEGETYFKAKNTTTSTAIALDAAASNHGVWSYGYYDGTEFISSGKWMVYRNSSGNVILKGNAETATALQSSGTSAQFYRGDQTWSNEISGGLLKITNNSNTVTIGSNNANWCHFSNSASIPFYFNNSVSVNGNVNPHGTTNTQSLGNSSARWKTLYIGTANSYGGSNAAPIYWDDGVPTAVSNIELAVSSTTSRSVGVTNSNGSIKLHVATNRGIYDNTANAWMIYATKASDHTYIPMWASKGGSTTPVYFNSSGEPVACTAYSGLLTAMSWTGGTTAGPTLSVTVGGTNKTATIPTATASASGAVTTGNQTWAGNKTLTRTSGGDLAWSVTNSDTGLLVRLLVGTGKSNHGIYSNGYVNSSGTFTSGNAWIIYRGADSYVHCGTRLYGAVWNDYAEYRETKEKIEPGRCVHEVGDGTLILTTERLQYGCEIVSDTFGFAIGKSERCQTPTAASGRVLAYCLEGQEEAKNHIGEPVCSGPNGTVSIMTHEEEKEWPSKIIGTISEVPNYDIWIANDLDGEVKEEIKVNGRIWIRIR